MFVAVPLSFVALSLVLLTSCAGSEATTIESAAASTDRKTYSGEESFQNRCAVCHGQLADGTASGPPLVHRLYEIGHHPNFSFHNAVNNGVPAHHWNFGDMPAIPNVPPEEIDAIICHVRDLQRAEGITAGEPC